MILLSRTNHILNILYQSVRPGRGIPPLLLFLKCLCFLLKTFLAVFLIQFEDLGTEGVDLT